MKSPKRKIVFFLSLLTLSGIIAGCTLRKPLGTATTNTATNISQPTNVAVNQSSSVNQQNSNSSTNQKDYTTYSNTNFNYTLDFPTVLESLAVSDRLYLNPQGEKITFVEESESPVTAISVAPFRSNLTLDQVVADRINTLDLQVATDEAVMVGGVTSRLFSGKVMQESYIKNKTYTATVVPLQSGIYLWVLHISELGIDQSMYNKIILSIKLN